MAFYPVLQLTIRVRNAITSGSEPRFTLTASSSSYIFHVFQGDLKHDYYGPALDDPIPYPKIDVNGQTGLLTLESREFPDPGRGDFRLPAIHLRTKEGCTVSEFVYSQYEIIEGKHSDKDLPMTHGREGDVTSLKVYLTDEVNSIEVILNYAVFHRLDAITRSFELVNKGDGEIVVERAKSFSVDLPRADSDWEMVGLRGNWAREGRKFRRKVDWGIQGYVLFPLASELGSPLSSFRSKAAKAGIFTFSFHSTMGYSSHSHNPFVAIIDKATDEHTGPVYGFNLIYSGSHSTTIEKAIHGPVRVLMGVNPLHLSYPTVVPTNTPDHDTDDTGGSSQTSAFAMNPIPAPFDPKVNETADDHHEPNFLATFETYLYPVMTFILLPLFFGSIGYSIPFVALWIGESIWKGIVYALLMIFAKAICGLWLLIWPIKGREGGWLGGWRAALFLIIAFSVSFRTSRLRILQSYLSQDNVRQVAITTKYGGVVQILASSVS